MVCDMVRHKVIHLSNPDINYVRLENCRYCKMERMKNYDSHRRSNSVSNTIEYFSYNLVYYNPLFEEDFEDVELDTSLKRINSGTSLNISRTEDFCSICQDTIKKDVIVRKMNCGHNFHQECVDKWLETNKVCPICRYEI